MTLRTIAVISSGLRVPSTTRLLADQLGAAVARTLDGFGVEATLVPVELRDLAHAVTDALLTGFPAGDLRAAVDRIAAADGLIVVTPTFAASYSGLFKSFIDILEPDSLRDMPVLLAATGGSERHSLMIDVALRPLFAYLKATPVTTGVYAAQADFGGLGADALASRIDRAALELASAVAGGAASVSGSVGPQPSRQTGDTRPQQERGFVPFDQLLARVGAAPEPAGGNDIGAAAETAYDRFRRAEREVTDQRYREAVTDLEALLAESDPGVGVEEARLLLARAYFGSAQLKKAEEMAREVLRSRPDDAYAARLLARSLQRQSRHDEAAGPLALASALDR